MSSSKNKQAQTYFNRVPAREWCISDVVKYYEEEKNLPIATIIPLIEADAKEIAKAKKSLEPQLRPIIQDLEDSILIKKAKKLYDIKQPIISPSISNNKPRLPSDDISKLNVIVDIMIANNDGASGPAYEEYQRNMDEQESNYHLKKSPNLLQFLQRSLSGTLDEMLALIWDTTNCCEQGTKIELQFIRFLQYFLTDYHANCIKPPLQSSSNERTPFSEHVIPVFKYFTAATGLLSFAWCEKQSASNKGLLICFPENYKRHLMDGIGYSVKDNIELVELLLMLQNMLVEQEKVTEDLKLEHVGLKQVDPEDVIRKRVMNKQ
ncbi:hypothetical protein DFQ29_002343 [Apophysomyces sp. BC1021]|nr:hypothetical protein DFQ29_002343 [Apophysomyces sp. BC1021]